MQYDSTHLVLKTGLNGPFLIRLFLLKHSKKYITIYLSKHWVISIRTIFADLLDKKWKARGIRSAQKPIKKRGFFFSVCQHAWSCVLLRNFKGLPVRNRGTFPLATATAWGYETRAVSWARRRPNSGKVRSTLEKLWYDSFRTDHGILRSIRT